MRPAPLPDGDSAPTSVPLEVLLSQRLRESAEQRGIPLSRVAERAGISHSYLWHLLAARCSATLMVVQRLAGALGVDALALLQAAPPRRTRAPAEPRTRRRARTR